MFVRTCTAAAGNSVTGTFVSVDFEFTGLTPGCLPLSMGAVLPSGEKLYVEFAVPGLREALDAIRVGQAVPQELIESLGGDWVVANVLPKMEGTELVPLEEGARRLLDFVGDGYQGKSWDGSPAQKWDHVQLLLDNGSYDWMCLVRLFGGHGFNVPFFYIPTDLATVLFLTDINPDVGRVALATALGWNPGEEIAAHKASHDADMAWAIFQAIQENPTRVREIAAAL